jgi:hypothetical protein
MSPLVALVRRYRDDELHDIALDAKLAAGGRGEDGFTIIPDAIGAWRSESSRKYREPIRIYWLDVVDEEPVREALGRLAQRIGIELAQESVYVTVSPLAVISVTQFVVT